MDYVNIILSAALLTFGVVYTVSMHQRFARLERRVDALHKLARGESDAAEGS